MTSRANQSWPSDHYAAEIDADTNMPTAWTSKRTPTLFEVTDAAGDPVLRIRGGMMPVEATAQLITAAPELYAALVEAYKALCVAADYGNLSGAELHILETARYQAEATLLKAEVKAVR